MTIYAEQRLEATLEFQGEKIASVPRRPVVAAALTYEPMTGTVEVAANTKMARDNIVRAFAQNLVDKSTNVAAVPPRRFTLQHLKRPHKFPTDAVDLIEEVTLRSLRLMPLGREDQRLTLEIGRHSSRSIWEMAQSQFMERNPLVGGWLVTSATLAVTFRPRGKGIHAIGRGRGVNRSAANPLEVQVLADEALPLVHDRVVAWDALVPDIFQRMLLAGCAVDSPADAALLHPTIFPNAEQAKKALQRGVFGGQIPISNLYRDLSLKSAAYRRRGRGRSWQRVWWLEGPESKVQSQLMSKLGLVAAWG